MPAGTADKLNKIHAELVSAFNEFVFRVERGRDEDTAGRWIKIVEHVGDEIRVALRELESDFRRLLGEEASQTDEQIAIEHSERN